MTPLEALREIERVCSPNIGGNLAASLKLANIHGIVADALAAVPPEPAPTTPPRFGMTAADVAKREQLARPDLTTEEIVAAAPPTVAPARTAREVAQEFVRTTAVCNVYAPYCRACVRWENAVTALLKRDRASRSPGAASVVLASLGFAALSRGQQDANLEHNTGHVSHALRGEGPSPAREGLELKSESLGGLDAATVEARERVLETALVRLRDACPEGGGCMWCYGCCAVEECCHESSDCEFKHDVDCPATIALEALAEAARIRALATPPGQTKP